MQAVSVLKSSFVEDLLHSKSQKMRHSTPALPLFVLSRQPAVLDLSFNVLDCE